MTQSVLTAHPDGFRRAGQEHRILSGGLHYFRVHPDLWRDRMLRLRALGLNTVETYVAWNVHQPTPDAADFTGWNDVAGFVRLAGELGFDVIVRPGPYICAEWEFGGLPSWLLTDPAVRLRCDDPAYLHHVEIWFDRLLPLLTPLQAETGGPIVAWQVENEYGSFGDDAAYLARVRDLLLERGVTGLLFTSDGPTEGMLAHGTVPGLPATVNFGSRSGEAFAQLRKSRPDDPLMCMEFWNGWFDHWDEHHHTRAVEDSAGELDAMLAAGASVNLYMAHGGTNFGLWSGANDLADGYAPTITSYDYDAPIGEAGELTPKFHAFRDVISRYAPVPDDLPPDPPRLAEQAVTTTPVGHLFVEPDGAVSAVPRTMEELGQSSGLLHYVTEVDPAGETTLTLRDLHDRTHVFADGTLLGVLPRGTGELTLPAASGRIRLDVLVENQGRVNYGPELADRKGILGGVLLGARYHFGWCHHPIPLDSPPVPGALGYGPTLHRAEIEIDSPADGFLDPTGWSKGFCWLNGFLLGRYWDVGPQRTLYAPAPLWRAGRNEIVLLELDHPSTDIALRAQPDLG